MILYAQLIYPSSSKKSPVTYATLKRVFVALVKVIIRAPAMKLPILKTGGDGLANFTSVLYTITQRFVARKKSHAFNSGKR
jgi:hypothetical protein